MASSSVGLIDITVLWGSLVTRLPMLYNTRPL